MNIKEFYDKRAKSYKEGWQAAHWSSKETQQDTFSLLTQIAPFEPKDCILDLGCGQGDLFRFIQKMGWKINYEGIDISSSMIDRAWKNNPKGKFACIDFLDDRFNFEYDWILASGPFNHKVDGDQYEYIGKCFKKMYQLSKKGFGTILTTEHYKGEKTEYLFHYNPIKCLEILFDISNVISFNHTAFDWGFLVFVYNEKWMNA